MGPGSSLNGRKQKGFCNNSHESSQSKTAGLRKRKENCSIEGRQQKDEKNGRGVVGTWLKKSIQREGKEKDSLTRKKKRIDTRGGESSKASWKRANGANGRGRRNIGERGKKERENPY